jgi:20S proteasome alpha/beta subunit
MALYRVEPTGQFYRCRAAAAGRAYEDASAWLADRLSETEAETSFGDASSDHSTSPVDEDTEASELIQVALQFLLQTKPRNSEDDGAGSECYTDGSAAELGSSSSVDDFQVGVVSAAAGFRFLTTAELAAALKAAEASK